MLIKAEELDVWKRIISLITFFNLVIFLNGNAKALSFIFSSYLVQIRINRNFYRIVILIIINYV